jgi:hypothetical protein
VEAGTALGPFGCEAGETPLHFGARDEGFFGPDSADDAEVDVIGDAGAKAARTDPTIAHLGISEVVRIPPGSDGAVADLDCDGGRASAERVGSLPVAGERRRRVVTRSTDLTHSEAHEDESQQPILATHLRTPP